MRRPRIRVEAEEPPDDRVGGQCTHGRRSRCTPLLDVGPVDVELQKHIDGFLTLAIGELRLPVCPERLDHAFNPRVVALIERLSGNNRIQLATDDPQQVQDFLLRALPRERPSPERRRVIRAGDNGSSSFSASFATQSAARGAWRYPIAFSTFRRRGSGFLGRGRRRGSRGPGRVWQCAHSLWRARCRRMRRQQALGHLPPAPLQGMQPCLHGFQMLRRARSASLHLQRSGRRESAMAVLMSRCCVRLSPPANRTIVLPRCTE